MTHARINLAVMMVLMLGMVWWPSKATRSISRASE
jgi:hypothetical protein